MQKMIIRAEAPRSKRNPIAASLRAGQFRKQVVRDRTKYARKARNGKGWEA